MTKRGQYIWVIDQVGGQVGWILAKFFFACFHKHAIKERGQYPVILTEQGWSIKDLLNGFRGNVSLGTRRVVNGVTHAGFPFGDRKTTTAFLQASPQLASNADLFPYGFTTRACHPAKLSMLVG